MLKVAKHRIMIFLSTIFCTPQIFYDEYMLLYEWEITLFFFKMPYLFKNKKQNFTYLFL